MAIETVTHDSLVRFYDAGVVEGTLVVGKTGGWELLVKLGKTEMYLAAQRGHIRMFRKFDTIVDYLIKLGVTDFAVNTAEFDPKAPPSEKAKRAACRLRETHQAAAVGRKKA